MSKKTSTLDVISAVSGDEVIVAGEIADIHFSNGNGLSLTAAKAFIAMLDHAGAKIIDDVEHCAPLREIITGGHRSSVELIETINELHKTIVALTYVDRAGLRRRKSSVLVAEVDCPLDTTSAEIRWRYPNAVRYLVKNSSHWAGISARAVLLMECKYSPWLYQLVALHAGRRQPFSDWPLADLRDRLGATARSLQRWQEFKRSVLEPAVAEINHLTGITVHWEAIKQGRRVVAVRITADKKDNTALDAAETELSHPRLGRKARRTDTVVSLADKQVELRRALAEELENLPHLNSINDEFIF